MRGRPPKPLETHLLDGTHRADRHGDGSDHVPADGSPVMPATFTGEARALWETVVAGLVACKVARAVDTPALVMLCESWARYRKVSAALDALDPEQDSVAFGRLSRAAALHWQMFDKIAGRFGMTPADRMRLRVDAQEKKQGVIARQRQ
jgi:P27 family predicted phage terminase small subunit